MAKDSSFDVVSQVDMQEMDNAVNQTKKEIAQRYDFRGSDASIELEEKCIKLAAEDEYKLSAIIDMLRARMAKRDIPLRCLELGKVEPASKGTVRQTLTILQGIPKERKFQRRGVEEYYKVIFIVGVKKEYSEFF